MSVGYCEKCGKKSALTGKCFNPECTYIAQLEAVAEESKSDANNGVYQEMMAILILATVDMYP
jgi:hypothetical protein